MTRDGTGTRLDRLARDAFAGIGEAEPFLRDWPDEAPLRSPSPRGLPVLAWLGAARAVAPPAFAPVVAALVDAAGTLAWGQTYAASAVGEAFLDAYGWTEFVGTRGPVPSERIACGVLLLGPGTDYPLHAHAAEEVYLPVAGTALWRRGEDGDVRSPPGRAIHHPPWMPHAMRTETEPLLALYLWRGQDLAAPSRLLARGSDAGKAGVWARVAEERQTVRKPG